MTCYPFFAKWFYIGPIIKPGIWNRFTGTRSEAADAAHALRDQEAAQLESVEEAQALMQAGTRSEDITAAEASVAAAQAQREQAATAVKDTRLIAPSRGLVLTLAREPGSFM
ncbi:MAG: HlyD family secretion protein [Porticoccaceae bacterium]